MKKLAREIPRFENHERFLKFIGVSGECWEWQGSITEDGYGRFHIIDGDYPAHRVSFSIFKHSPSEFLVIDHVCRNRSCVNPEHLREVTENTNTLENSLSGAAINKNKTVCIRGHEFYLLPGGKRRCRVCANNSRIKRRSMGYAN